MDLRKSKKTKSYAEARKESKETQPFQSSSQHDGKARTYDTPLASQSTQSGHEGHETEAVVNVQGLPEGNGIVESSLPTSKSPNFSHNERTSQPYVSSSNADQSKNVPEVNFAVIGAKAVGKSTFLRCALDLKKPLNVPFSSKKMSLEGSVYMVKLIEVQLESVRVASDKGIQWPNMLGGQKMPHIDGTLILYNVMDKRSVAHISHILNALFEVRMPCVLVSCKCDNSPSTRLVDQDEIEQMCNSSGFHDLEPLQTSMTAPETHKQCISVMLRSLIADKPETSDVSVRPRASTTSSGHGSSGSAQCQAKSLHSRATSELTASTGTNRSSTSTSFVASTRGTSTRLSQDDRQPQRSPNPSDVLRKSSSPPLVEQSLNIGIDDRPVSNEDSSHKENLAELGSASIPSLTSRSPSLTRTATDPVELFLDANEVLDGESSSEGVPSITRLGTGFDDMEAKGPGFSFDDLVDRLLSQPMSKTDVKFTAVFLCLYRKFASPAELMSAVIFRFENLNENENPQIIRISSQLRYLNILAQWIFDYPGDFAYPLTRRYMIAFIAQLAGNRVFAAAAKEMGSCLEHVLEDDDTEWACSDASRGFPSLVKSYSKIRSLKVIEPISNLDFPIDTKGEPDGESIGIEDVRDLSPRHSTTPSISSSADRSGSQSNSSSQTPLFPIEGMQRQTQLLTPTSRNTLNKIQWRQFMDISDEDIARELTRMDWIMFSSIKPRDLVRHVSLPAEQRTKCKCLENVDRMINHFNHLAFWVANMVLLRDKPKHRAQALEKFMGVAWKLRHFNNYNSLGAIIAGISGTPVHRLAQTRELVTPQVQKDFMRLEILMGTQKSHFAYRLAWENTSSERIPFLPLHRRDLVSAEEGNSTFLLSRDDCINWRKFEIMGEVIIGVQQSQGTPHPNMARNIDVQRLVLDAKFSKDDDELYDRSLHLEGPGLGETSRRRFNWFQR